MSLLGLGNGDPVLAIPDIMATLPLTITGENGTLPPLYRPAAQNGLGVIELDRVAMRAIRSAVMTPLEVTTLTWFCIRAWREAYESHEVGLFGFGDTGPRVNTNWWDVHGASEWYDGGLWHQHCFVDDIVVDRYDILHATMDADGVTNLYRNGVLKNTHTFTWNWDGEDGVTTNAFVLGSTMATDFVDSGLTGLPPGTNAGNIGSSHLGEFLTFGSVLSVEDQALALANLSTKWNIPLDV